MTLTFSVYFILVVYLTWSLVNEKCYISVCRERKLKVEVSLWRWAVVMALGIVSTLFLINTLGDGIVDGYRNLLLLRAGRIERTIVTSNLFSLVQSFGICASIGILIAMKKKSAPLFVSSIVLCFYFAIMSGARRTLGIELLIVYFSRILVDNRFHIARWLMPLTFLLAPVIMFGERIASAFTFRGGSSISSILEAPTKEDIVILFGDIGVSVVESWATILYLHIPWRFGIDHLLSVVRRFPEGFLGLSFDFPERVVRISTAAFVGPERQDIPPGLLGQMWLDAGVFGPILWGVAFGLQLSMLQYMFNRMKMEADGVGMVMSILFVVALPLNTGSFDFSTYIDIFALMIFILFMARVRKLEKV